MKTITHIAMFVLLLNLSAAESKERGVHIDTPIKGLLLSGLKEGRKITKGVVFLTGDGVVYSADSAIISKDQKSILFRGKPLISDGSTRTFSEGKDEWVRVSSDGKVEKSNGQWNLRQIEINQRNI